ncbi:hypothetical protein V8G54_026204 [Vigna mungo]|uniref:Uncharacterized protein n=1 Tax=Vigna mungo TaxID=3915 RepID=A0AAQ3MYB4_VIGMU
MVIIAAVFFMGFFSVYISHYSRLSLRKHPQPHWSHRHFPHSRVLRGEDPQAWKRDVFAECIDEARTTVMTESAAVVEVMRFMVAAERGDDARDFVDRRRWRQKTILGFSLQLGFIDLGLSVVEGLEKKQIVDRRRWRQKTILGFSLQLGFIDLGLSVVRG